MKELWKLRQRAGDYDNDSIRLGVSPMVLRLLHNRDIKDDKSINEFINLDVSRIYSYTGLPDIDKAATSLMIALSDPECKIRIIGDYDVDGIMSTLILLKGLDMIRDSNIDYVLPDRITNGYGLNDSLVSQAKEDGVNFLITCDNGITANEPIAKATKEGMRVVVTDHHEPAYIIENEHKIFQVPVCEAVVDPKLPDNHYPYINICGAVVAFKLLCAVYDVMGADKTWLTHYIYFAAVATVCDIMPIVGVNRDIVRIGLKQMNDGITNAGLKHLCQLQNVKEGQINTYTVGFVIGPCLNAAGRLETADIALKMLLSNDIEHSNQYAKKLKELNDERKALSEEFSTEAIEMAQTDEYVNDKVIVLYMERCPQSIAGLVAGKVKEAVNKPTLVITPVSEDEVKGSGRSIDKYNLHDELTKVKHLLKVFGGHEQAAGFTLSKSNVQALRQELNANCTLSDSDLDKQVLIDMVLHFSDITLDFIEQLDVLEPFCTGNRKPLFITKNVSVMSSKLVGANANVCQLQLKTNEQKILRAVAFKNAQEMHSFVQEHVKLDICYNLNVNVWNDKKNIQLVIQHYRSSEE